MELWMILVTLCALCGTVGVAIWVFLSEVKRVKLKDEFLEELDRTAVLGDGVAGLPLPTVEIAAYEQALQAMHDQFYPDEPLIAPICDLETSDDEDDEEDDGIDRNPIPWQRRLPVEQKATLKSLLVKRTMACIPTITSFFSDYSARYRLNQLQLMDGRHWTKIEGYSEALDKEINVIRREAEAIQEDWGSRDLVFRDARLFYQHETNKVEKAKEQARLEAERVRDEKKAAIAAEKEKRMAERMMQALLKQEENAAAQKKAAAPKSTSS